MNPILLGTLVNVGKNVLDHFMPGKVQKAADTAAEFASHLRVQKAQEAPQSSLGLYLSQNGISNMNGVQALRSQLINKLASDPEISKQLGGAQPTHLIKEEGSFALQLSNGKIVSLDGNPLLQGAASKVHTLSCLQEYHRFFPSSSLSQLASKVSQMPQIKAKWAIA